MLAEFGTGLCIAALAFAGGSGPGVALVGPGAILTAWLLDFRNRGDKAIVNGAISRAIAALKEFPDLSDDDINVANSYLQARKESLSIEPEAMARAAKTGDLPAALFELVTDAGHPPEAGAARAIHLTLEAVYAVCRTRNDYHTIFTQEVLIDLSNGHGVLFDSLERVARQTSQSLQNDKGIIAGISEIKVLISNSFPQTVDVATALKNERLATARLLDEISEHGISATEVTRFLKVLIALEIDIVKAGEIVKDWKKNG